MAGASSTRLSAAAGRRFAFTLALGFGLVALLLLWRDRQMPMRVAAVLAVLMTLAGLAVPRHLGPLERAWARLGMVLGRVTAPVFIGAVYWLIITPFGFLRRTLGRSPMTRRPEAGSFWIVREPDTRDPRDRMTRQY